jgi:hypothetical protein
LRDQFVDAQENDRNRPENNDGVEIFIDGDQVPNDFRSARGMGASGSNEGFQILANAAGHQLTVSRDFTNQDWKAAAKRTSDGYIIEMEIPPRCRDKMPGQALRQPDARHCVSRTCQASGHPLVRAWPGAHVPVLPYRATVIGQGGDSTASFPAERVHAVSPRDRSARRLLSSSSIQYARQAAPMPCDVRNLPWAAQVLIDRESHTCDGPIKPRARSLAASWSRSCSMSGRFWAT